jgi:hypothetical protein
MILTGAVIYFVLTSDEFQLAQAEVSADVRYADVDEMLAAVDLSPSDHPNVFELPAEDARQKLLAFPGIAAADVRAILPNRVLVTVTERPPILVLHRGSETYAIDGNGVVLASIDEQDVAALALPAIADERREWATEVALGAPLDPTDLSAILQLGALTPATIGSGADSLAVSVDDEDGFVITAEPYGWRAVFGHYTPTLRPPDLVPRQVQCLRSLLAGGETRLETIYLAPQEERCGTFLPSGPPRPRNSPTPDPSA